MTDIQNLKAAFNQVREIVRLSASQTPNQEVTAALAALYILEDVATSVHKIADAAEKVGAITNPPFSDDSMPTKD